MENSYSDSDKYDDLINILEDFLGNHKNRYSTKGQITFNCPQCADEKGLETDGKGNLEVNYKMGKFNCWSCGETSGMRGSLSYLINRCGGKESLAKFLALKIVYEQDSQYGDATYTRAAKGVQLPVEYNTLIDVPKLGVNKAFFNYLTARGITDEIIKKFKIGYSIMGTYANRVILPSFDEDGDINYFVTRAIGKASKYKYLNCDVKKQTIIFNEHLINWKKTVIIVEGPFDHIVIPNSIPLLGKEMGDLLFGALYLNAEADIIVILDDEAWEYTKKIYNKLDGGRLRGRVSAVKMPINIDVSKFHETYGQAALFNYIKENRIKLID